MSHQVAAFFAALAYTQTSAAQVRAPPAIDLYGDPNAGGAGTQGVGYLVFILVVSYAIAYFYTWLIRAKFLGDQDPHKDSWGWALWLLPFGGMTVILIMHYLDL